MKNSNASTSIIMIGCGPHAKRIYLPALKNLIIKYNLKLALVIDLKSEESLVQTAISDQWKPEPELWFIDPFTENIPEELDHKLTAFVFDQKVSGVIIATEPLVHRTYAEWALRNQLSILIDKPISARMDSTTKISSADGIIEDYELLFEQYKNLQEKKETVFIVNSQRRFHTGFQFVEQQLTEIGQRTNCPVTFIQSYHSDGQWRFPSEIVTQGYHPYCLGYGKASHSGYHIFDTVYRLYKAAGIPSKTADSMEIVSSFVQPNGFIKQFSESDYVSLFGESYNSVKEWNDDQLQGICQDYGEIDLSAVITLLKDQEAIANLSINLIHNGYACRTWLEPGKDLYKGNGRVKHENYNIQQGPFQNIQIHSYQATDKHDELKGIEDDLGGKNHFDIYVFRNPLVDGLSNSPKVYKLTEVFSGEDMATQSMLVMEHAKHQVVEEFVEYLLGKKEKSILRSQIEDHIVPVQIMSGIYRSHILRRNKSPCLVSSNFGFARDSA